MRDFISERALNIQESGIRRFFELANTYDDIISLGVGEPDFPTPWHVRDEAIYAIQKGKTFYTSNAGLMELREAIADEVKLKTQTSYNPKTEIIVTCGGSEAIDLALRSTINPGDEVIYCIPAYVTYVSCIKLADGIPVEIHLKEENQFRLTADQLRAAITPKSKILMLNYPNNPTGAIMEKEDLEAIADLIIEHDLLVITDEIYSELTYLDKPHASVISIPGMRERTIYMNGFSKAYAMTGWRLGYLCAPDYLTKHMAKVHQATIMAVSTISQFAGIEALRNGQADIDQMRESYNQRRRYLVLSLREMGLPCFEPLGAFYVFPNISQFGMTSEEFAMKLIEDQHLAVIPGSVFGDSGEGFVRISYAYSMNQLRVAMARLAKFIEKLQTSETQPLQTLLNK